MQFSIHRIWLLIRKQWAENQQLYILGTLAIAGIMGAIIVFNMSSPRGLEKHTQQFILFLGSIAAGGVFTSTILSQFNEKVKGIQALTLPASALEKLTVAVIYCMVIFPVVYFVMVYPLIMIGHYIDNSIAHHPNALYNLEWDDDAYELFVTYFVLQTVALLGSVLFKRYVFIKSLIMVMVVFFGLCIINPIVAKCIIDTDGKAGFSAYVLETVYDEANKPIYKETVKAHYIRPNVDAVPYADIVVNYGGYNRYVKGASYSAYQTKLHHQYNTVFLILLYLGMPFLWTITWFKLKEKEL